jgi:hypothetical protein
LVIHLVIENFIKLKHINQKALSRSARKIKFIRIDTVYIENFFCSLNCLKNERNVSQNMGLFVSLSEKKTNLIIFLLRLQKC